MVLGTLVSNHIFITLVFQLNHITEAAVNVDGGAKNVDHGLVISLLREIVVLLHVALKDLKGVAVVKDFTLNNVACTLRGLVGIITDLLIVRIFHILFQCPDLISSLLKSYGSSWFRRCHPLRRHHHHWVCYILLDLQNVLFLYFVQCFPL